MSTNEQWGAVCAQAATKIAAIQRGKQDRKQVAGKKIEAELGLTGSEEESAAIAKMQAQQRGKMARKVRSLLPCASRLCWSLCSRSSAERPAMTAGACREERGHCRGVRAGG